MKRSVEVYDFNILISCRWGTEREGKEEARRILRSLGDGKPTVRRTLAAGILGARTNLDPHQAVQDLWRLFEDDPSRFHYTLKWLPVYRWAFSDIDSMRDVVRELRALIVPGERWRVTVEKRRYTRHHKIEIIRELAEEIDEVVDLENPEKILRVDIIGRYAGISVLTPGDIFSVTKASVAVRGGPSSKGNPRVP